MVQQCEKLFNQNDRLLKHVEVSISNVKKAQKDQIAKRQKETQRRQEVVEKIDTSVPLDPAPALAEDNPKPDHEDTERQQQNMKDRLPQIDSAADDLTAFGYKSSFSTQGAAQREFQFKRDMWGSELATKDTRMNKQKISMPPLRSLKNAKTTRNDRNLSTLNPSRSKKTIELLEVSQLKDHKSLERPESPTTPAIIRGNQGFDNYLNKKMMVWHQNSRVGLTTKDQVTEERALKKKIQDPSLKDLELRIENLANPSNFAK